MTDLDKRQYDLLKRLEWRMEDNSYYPTQRFCPICSGTQPSHQPDCELWHVLTDAQNIQRAKTSAAQDPLNADQRWSEYNVPLCPQCGSKAVYQSAISFTDRTRVCQCAGQENEHDQQIQQHTWVINEQGVEV